MRSRTTHGIALLACLALAGVLAFVAPRLDGGSNEPVPPEESSEARAPFLRSSPDNGEQPAQSSVSGHRTESSAMGIRGRVVDAASGDGIPFVNVLIHGANHAANVLPQTTTLEDGRFSFADCCTLHSLTVRDLPSGFIKRVDRREYENAEVRVEIGPTYLLLFEDPGSVDVELWGTLSVQGHESPELKWRQVQRTPRPWIRFGPALRGQASLIPGSVLLTLQDRDGTKGTSVRVPSTVGVMTIGIRLENRSSINGIVVLAAGIPTVGASVEIEPLAGQEMPPAINSSFVTDAEGHFSFSNLVAGRYRLMISKPSYLPFSTDLTLSPGEERGVRIQWPNPEGFEVSGFFVSPGGLQYPLPSLSLRCVDRPELVARAEAQLETASNGQSDSIVRGRFEFRGLDAGEYDLSLADNGVTSRYQDIGWTPRRIRVRAPHHGIQFLRSRGRWRREVMIRAQDANSGEDIVGFDVLDLRVPSPSFSIDTGGGTGATVARDCRFGIPVAVGPIAEGVPFRWAVTARGYQIVAGDESDLSLLEHGGDTYLGGTVTLRSGFGAVIQVFAERSSGVDGPVPGVSVYLDDTLAGTSDSNGLCILSWNTTPTRIEVRKAGFHTAAVGNSSGFAVPENRRTVEPFLKFLLRRD